MNNVDIVPRQVLKHSPNALRASPYCPQDRGCGHVPNALRANRAYATRCGFDLCHKYILYLYLYLYFTRLGQMHHTVGPVCP
jgi:hypothetical protein